MAKRPGKHFDAHTGAPDEYGNSGKRMGGRGKSKSLPNGGTVVPLGKRVKAGAGKMPNSSNC